MKAQGTVREMIKKHSNTDEEPTGPSAKRPKHKVILLLLGAAEDRPTSERPRAAISKFIQPCHPHSMTFYRGSDDRLVISWINL